MDVHGSQVPGNSTFKKILYGWDFKAAEFLSSYGANILEDIHDTKDNPVDILLERCD